MSLAYPPVQFFGGCQCWLFVHALFNIQPVKLQLYVSCGHISMPSLVILCHVLVAGGHHSVLLVCEGRCLHHANADTLRTSTAAIIQSGSEEQHMLLQVLITGLCIASACLCVCLNVRVLMQLQWWLTA